MFSKYILGQIKYKYDAILELLQILRLSKNYSRNTLGIV